MPRSQRPIEERHRDAVGDGLLTQESLRHHTTFRIGGPADYYYAAPTAEKLVAALTAAREAGVPVFLLGGGSNLLVSDEGFRGLVIRNAIPGRCGRAGCLAVPPHLRRRPDGSDGLIRRPMTGANRRALLGACAVLPAAQEGLRAPAGVRLRSCRRLSPTPVVGALLGSVVAVAANATQ